MGQNQGGAIMHYPIGTLARDGGVGLFLGTAICARYELRDKARRERIQIEESAKRIVVDTETRFGSLVLLLAAALALSACGVHSVTKTSAGTTLPSSSVLSLRDKVAYQLATARDRLIPLAEDCYATLHPDDDGRGEVSALFGTPFRQTFCDREYKAKIDRLTKRLEELGAHPEPWTLPKSGER